MRIPLSLLFLCFAGATFPAHAADTDNTPVQVPREKLRYDGKTFEQWRDSLLTELKPERRVEALKAMRSFGVRGYGREAASAVARVLKDGIAQGLPEPTFSFQPPQEKGPNDDELYVTGEAALVLYYLGEPAVPFVVELLKDPNGQELLSAMLCDKKFTDTALKPSVPALVDYVCSGNRRLSLCAAGILATRVDSLGPALKKALKNERRAKRFMAAIEAVPPQTSEWDYFVLTRVAAASALDQLQGRTKVSGKALIALIRGATWEVQGNITPVSAPPADPLEQAAVETAKKKMLARALKLLHPKQRVPALLQAYHELPAERCRIATALGELGPSAKEALPVLTQAQQDPNAELRQAAAAAIQKINAKEKKVPEQE
jgi:HEAT repeat protein